MYLKTIKNNVISNFCLLLPLNDNCTWARLLLQHPKFYTNILFFTYFKGQLCPLYVHWMPDDNQEHACITDLTLCWKKLGSRYLSYLLANSTLISVHLTWNRTKENVQGYPILSQQIHHQSKKSLQQFIVHNTNKRDRFTSYVKLIFAFGDSFVLDSLVKVTSTIWSPL